MLLCSMGTIKALELIFLHLLQKLYHLFQCVLTSSWVSEANVEDFLSLRCVVINQRQRQSSVSVVRSEHS